MLTLLQCVITAWSDYFTTTNPKNLDSQTYSSRQTFSDTSVYIFNCLFRSITSTSNGGALHCTTSVTYLLIELTSFFSCSTSGRCGGAIYFSTANNGQSVLHEVCGYDCCSTYTSSSSNSQGQFAHINMNSYLTNKNYVNYSSIICCINQISNSHYTLDLVYGKICCPSVNISMNKCPHGSGIHCYPFIDSNSATCSLTYSSFADNNAPVSVCIYFWRGANYEIKSCNILRNTQNSLGSHGVFFTHDNVLIENSCILENKATYIFYQGHSSYTITLSNCTIDSTSSNLNINTQNTITKSFILALNHVSNIICHSEYDSVGTLTPIIQSPSSSKKQKHCYTGWNINSYHSNLRIFFSIFNIFVFNFIHLDASCNPLY
jgi:hypothetical protein